MTFRRILSASVVTVMSFLHIVSSDFGNVRLTGGTRYKGRVEINDGQEWGIVCDDYWSQQEGDVVCRQLGFVGAVRALRGAEVTLAYGPTQRDIFLDDLTCDGREQNLFQCGHAGLRNHNCGRRESAGVECIRSSDIRLVMRGSTHSTKGFVEVNVNGEWGKVCDDGWDENSARVACRELGRDLVDWNPTIRDHLFGVQYIIDDIECDGSETQLLRCEKRSLWYSNCADFEAASVECSAT